MARHKGTTLKDKEQEVVSMQFLKAHLSVKIALVLYFIYSTFYKTMNPLKWSYADSFLY